MRKDWGGIMASQDKLRVMFNEMNLEQKGNFINNLKQSLEGSEDEDSLQFLNECIGHYTMEMEYEASLKEEADLWLRLNLWLRLSRSRRLSLW